MKTLNLILAICLIGSSSLFAEQVTYRVKTPSTTILCNLCGVPTGWKDLAMQLESTDLTGAKIFSVTLEITVPANKDVYKYRCGPSWTFEEIIDANKTKWNPGRNYPSDGSTDVVYGWLWVCTPLTYIVTVPDVSPSDSIFLKGNFIDTNTSGGLQNDYPNRANGNPKTRLIKQADGTYKVTIYSNRHESEGYGAYRVHAGNGDIYNETDTLGIALPVERASLPGENRITVARWNEIENGMNLKVSVPLGKQECYIANKNIAQPVFYKMYKNSNGTFTLPLTPEIVSNNFTYNYFSTTNINTIESPSILRNLTYVANTTQADKVTAFSAFSALISTKEDVYNKTIVIGDELIIKSEGKINVQLYSIEGSLINSYKGMNEVRTEPLHSGTYILIGNNAFTKIQIK